MELNILIAKQSPQKWRAMILQWCIAWCNPNITQMDGCNFVADHSAHGFFLTWLDPT